MANTICIIGAYFGKFNNYFPLWLRSCAYNSKIDFIIFNDCPAIKNVPINVKMIPFTIQEMKALAIKKTGIKNLYLDKPYKCCDFKPLYGEIFQDYISKYEYWGHCDFDLIWGDIYGFLEKFEYKKYDKFLNLGHLSLYRNTPEVNHRYTEEGSMDNYLKVLTVEQNMAFDENGGMCKIYMHNKYPFFYKRIYADISPIYFRYRLSEYCSLEEPDKNYTHQLFFWDKGKTYRAYIDSNKNIQIEEYMYIHFQKRPNYPLSSECIVANTIFLTNEGFIPKVLGDVSEDDIKQYNKYIPFIEKIELLNYKFTYYWKALKRRLLIWLKQIEMVG